MFECCILENICKAGRKMLPEKGVGTEVHLLIKNCQTQR